MQHKNGEVLFYTSNCSSPVSNLFKQPLNAVEWEQYVLSDHKIGLFKKNGYVSAIKALSEKQVDVLNTALLRLQTGSKANMELFYHYESTESEAPEKILFYAIGAWLLTPGFHALVWSTAYQMAAYQLLNQSVRLFHNQLFYKSATHGGIVAKCQNFFYRTLTKPMQQVTCSIGVHDARIENGCLYYIPVNYKWSLLPVTCIAGDMDAVNKVLDADLQITYKRKIANELPMVNSDLCHPLMMHGLYAEHA